MLPRSLKAEPHSEDAAPALLNRLSNKRIYIDYLRNGRGTTAVGPYSPRARESQSPRW